MSPLLFILAIDPPHRILEADVLNGALAPLPTSCLKVRASLYADDAILFVNPVKEEVDTLLDILHRFGAATAL